MKPTYATRNQDTGQRRSQSGGFLVGIGLAMVLALGVLATAPRGDHDARDELLSRVNPNTASVASLARLPGIGLARASAIVAYRTQFRAETGRETAFQRPDDLQRIRGIGPKTVQEIATWLDFAGRSLADAAVERPSPAEAAAR